MLKWVQNLLDPRGTLSRKSFWHGHLLIIIATVIFGIMGGLGAVVASKAFGIDEAKIWGPLVATCLAFAFAVYAEIIVASKRFRDRGYSSFMPMVLLIGLGISNYAVGFGRYIHGNEPLTAFDLMASILLAIGWLWLFVELGVRGHKERTVDMETDTHFAERFKNVVSSQKPVKVYPRPYIDSVLPHINRDSRAKLASMIQDRHQQKHKRLDIKV